MTIKEAAMNIYANKPGWKEEAEKMMGCKFDDMAPDQRLLAAALLAAFDGIWNK